jgi:hypothetical protein
MVGLRRDLPDYGSAGVTGLEIDVVEQHPDPHPTIHCPHLTLGEDVPGRVRLSDGVPEFRRLSGQIPDGNSGLEGSAPGPWTVCRSAT